MKRTTIAKLVRNYFKAYETKERHLLESLLSEDFTFTSPVDEGIDRNTYLARCWPSSKDIECYHINYLTTDGNEAMIRYQCVLKSGASFHNAEYFYFEKDKIKDIVVYFGTNLKQE